MKAVVALPRPSTMVDPGGSPSLLPRSAALRLRGEGASLTSLPRTPFTVSRKGAAPSLRGDPRRHCSRRSCSDVGEFNFCFPPRFVTITDASASWRAVPEGSAKFFFFLGRGGAAEGTLPRLDSKVLGTRGSVDEEHAIDAEQNERESRVAADAIDAKRTYDDVRRRRDLYASSPRKPEERRNEKHT